MLRVGIVGLPNVGKSTLFNALIRSRKAEASNYPFCTIEPNVGVVEVPDERLVLLAEVVKTKKIIPAAIEFVDIAGLVEGASHGEGLGNQFLGHIRQVDALIHVVRCFQNVNIVHTAGKVSPMHDFEVIQTELLLADLQWVEKQVERYKKLIKSLDKKAIGALQLLDRLHQHLDQGLLPSAMELSEEEEKQLKDFDLLTLKPMLCVANVAESDLFHGNEMLDALNVFLSSQKLPKAIVISAQLEAELGEFSKEEGEDYLRAQGIQSSGVSTLIRRSYELLSLATYFTAGEPEVHAWTFRLGMKAPECAGLIHTDFQKGFIRAEVTRCEDLLSLRSFQAVREAGKMRSEGKTYLFQDGDVALFRFSP